MVSIKTPTCSNAFPIQYMHNQKKDDSDFMLLYGSLKEFSLLDLIQLFTTMKKTGELRIVDKDNHRKAVLLFDVGLLVYASHEEAVGEEALVRVIGMNNGVFSFHNCKINRDKNLNLGTQAILMFIVQHLDKQ